jgi:hypothetical protein
MLFLAYLKRTGDVHHVSEISHYVHSLLRRHLSEVIRQVRAKQLNIVRLYHVRRVLGENIIHDLLS